MQPRFSIIIPTRGGTETLAGTLRTCLAQPTDDVEIIVSDNCSSPATREVVERFTDTRLRYVRSEVLLAMTDSWEFAISQATGQYLIILGDDDGLLLHALREIDVILRRLSDPPALRWNAAMYHWPNIAPNPTLPANRLLLPLGVHGGAHPLRKMRTQQAMLDCVEGRTSYDQLPNINITAVIRHDVVDELRRRTGRVFRSRTPDCYGAFAFAYLGGDFYSTTAPMTVCGLSGKSNGVARHALKGRSPITREFDQLNAAAGLGLHPWVPDLSPIPAAIADAYLQIREALFPDDPMMTFDRADTVERCLNAQHCENAEEYAEAIQRCREACEDDPELAEWFEATLARRQFTAHAVNPSERRYPGNLLMLDTTLFGVNDIFGAIELAERVLGFNRDGVEVRLEHTKATSANRAGPSESQRLREMTAVLHERTKIMNELKTAADERLKLVESLARTAAERLTVIESLSKIADERLVTIQRLESDLKQSHSDSERKRFRLRRA